MYSAPTSFHFRFAGSFSAVTRIDVAVHDELALLHVIVDRTVETAVYRVVLEHVSHVVYRNEVVDTYNLNVCIVACSTEYQTADTTETVDTNFDL